MKDKPCKYRWLKIGILFVSLLVVIEMTWYFTSQNGQVSHSTSISIAKSIEKTVAKNFSINQSDHFWLYTMDKLVRKGAHFIEYFLLGLITCALLNVLSRRVWLAAAISLVLCSIYAGLDEYRQNFVPGRTPRWFDWRVDVSGAVLGIVIATIVFLIFRYIYKLKARINELRSVRNRLS